MRETIPTPADDDSANRIVEDIAADFDEATIAEIRQSLAMWFAENTSPEGDDLSDQFTDCRCERCQAKYPNPIVD